MLDGCSVRQERSWFAGLPTDARERERVHADIGRPAGFARPSPAAAVSRYRSTDPVGLARTGGVPPPAGVDGRVRQYLHHQPRLYPHDFDPVP